MELHSLSLHEAAVGLKNNQWSSRQLTEACLALAKSRAETTHAFVEISDRLALADADAADERRRRERPLSDLDGIPLALKDNLMAVGTRTTAASNILNGYESAYDATVVRRLREAGAVLAGKTNMDEFAMGSSTESSCYGPTRNPWDQGKIPGGSSGGSAVAVAEGSALGALGTDTGGSIRQPAAMCGVVGLKPTYGRVSRYGAIAMASSLDQIGPLGRTVDDVAAILRIIEGVDPKDQTSVPLRDDWRLPNEISADVRGLRIGVPKEYFGSGLAPEVEKPVRAAIDALRAAGAEIKEVTLPHTEYALAAYYVIMPCEVSANLARFDGMRYGARRPAGSLEGTYRETRGRGFGREVRRRIMLGTYALSAGYYDAYYLQAQKVRRLIADDFRRAFAEVDCLVGPTSPVAAWNLGEMDENPLAMYLADVYTVSVNVAGLPAVSVPVGLAGKLPVGLQIIGRHFDEANVLRVAKAYENSRGAFPRPPGV